jgi:hypothetical protein
VQSSKILVTVAVWIVAATAFGLRVRGILLAKRFAWACLLLFIGAMLSLIAVEGSRKNTVVKESTALVVRSSLPAA